MTTNRTTQSQLINPTLLALLSLVKGRRSDVVSTHELFAEVRKNIEPSLKAYDLEKLPSGSRRIDQMIRNLVSNKALEGLVDIVNGNAKFTVKGRAEAFVAEKALAESTRRTLQSEVVSATLKAAHRLYSKSHRNVIKSDILRKAVLEELEPTLSAKDKAPLPSSPKMRHVDQVVINTLSSNRVMDKLGYTTYDNMTRKFTVNRQKVTSAVKQMSY